MTEFTRELMFGKRPVRRTNPKPGQSEWYYLDPRGTDRFEDMKQIDVPSENSPNPYANEIQNYLYNNDEYNYKQLYGNTPPPVQHWVILMKAWGQQLRQLHLIRIITLWDEMLRDNCKMICNSNIR